MAMILERIIKNYIVSSDQLDLKIEERDIIVLAGYFDAVEYYLDILELTPPEKNDVRDYKHRHGTQIAMKECLLFWRNHNPSRATLKTLLEILLKLGKEKLASDVCGYYFPKSK